MYENDSIAGNGMRRMFQAEIIAIVCSFVTLIPVLGWIVGPIGILVGMVLSMVGLYEATPAHANFKSAFNFTILNLVVSLLGSFVGDGALDTLLTVVGGVLGFVVTYYVCTAASELLSGKGDDYQAARGQLIWKLYLGCMVVATVCSILVIIPVIGVLAAVGALIAGIVQLVASIFYLIFLYNASQSLLS